MARKETWEIAEANCTKTHDGKPTPRSGAGFVFKADVHTETILYEVKSSECSDKDGPYIIVKAEWFRTAKIQALACGKDPAVELALGYPLSQFTFYFDPFTTEAPIGTLAVMCTRKVHLADFMCGVSALLIDGKVWIRR